MNATRERRQDWWICLGLTLAILAAYAPIVACGFVGYDDPDYVTANPMVQQGLHWKSVEWAFTTGHAGNWHPLTWLSHMLDCQMFGTNPLGHHLTSLALHVANSVLLFLILRQATGARWPSAVVAGLFGLHPMHVESVAWIAERKDVLSTFFWMLTVGAYASYGEPAKSAGPRRRLSYFMSIIFFALGLMAKPMLVTLPFLLLLLDVWPLRRVELGRWLWREKIPYLLLAGASSIVTFLVQQKTGAVVSLGNTSLVERLAAIPVAYVRYMGKTLVPVDLAILYPYPQHINILAALVSLMALGAITYGVWRERASQPWLAVGWLWFLGTLVPVIGIVQVGAQALADRYNYVPSIGLFILLVWSVWEWSPIHPGPIPAIGAVSVLGLCLYLTQRQVSYWQTSETLFRRSVAVSENNYMANTFLGNAYLATQQPAQAMVCFEEALRIAPNDPSAVEGMGQVYFMERRLDEAVPLLEQAVRMEPSNPGSHYNLGYARLAQGRVADALGEFDAQVKLAPEDFAAQNNFGDILLQQGLAEDAYPHFQEAARIRPEDADVHAKLGTILWQKGRAAEAEGEFEEALRLQPDNLQACSHLAWALATCPEASLRNGPRAVELAQRAEKLSGENFRSLGVLAAARAEVGDYSGAVAAATRARQLALGQTNLPAAEVLAQQLRLYQARTPVRDGSAQGTDARK